MSMASHLSVSRRIRGGSFDSSLSSDACSAPSHLRTISVFDPCIVSRPKEVRRQLAGGSLRPRHGRCRRRRSAQARKHANPAHAHKAACVRRGPMRPHSSCQRCLGSTATVPPPHSAPFLRLPRRRRRGVGAVRPLASAKTIQDTP